MSSSLSATEQALEAAVVAMTDPLNKALFDVTIICTTDDHQAAYWMERLSQGVCRKEHHDTTSSTTDNSVFPLVLAVSEDWNDAGGAGNGLGTLYAWTKATALAKTQHGGIDLVQLLQDGTISAALYHTAGKGTRLAPLPASENNNKPGVKLPVCRPQLPSSSSSSSNPEATTTTTSPPPLWTVLEAVVQQTGIYASSRRGRLSVFWGDQVFVPSAPYQYTSTHHVDILCTLLGDTAPTAEEWTAQGLDKYGVIAVLDGPQENAAQVEKVTHAQATAILSSLGRIQKVGPSLGSFSVSSVMLQALVQEFAPELSAKTAKLDTDPHFWMPLTLPAAEYVQLMSAKGEDATFLQQHYQRMAQLKESIMSSNTDSSSLGLLGAVNVGKDAGWWDYGQVKLYSKNSKLLLEPDTLHDAKLLRQFLGVSSRVSNTTTSSVVVDDSSLVSSCQVVSGGTITQSVVASVTAQSITADQAIVVNCASAKTIVAKPGSILYNVMSDDDILAEPGQVIVQVMEEESDHGYNLTSAMDIDGKDAWSVVLPSNTLSFEQAHAKNNNANVRLIQQKRLERYQSIQSRLGL